MGEAKFYYRNNNAPKPNKAIHIGACAIIKDNEKILFEKRKDSNLWALIGGGLKINESLEQCIIREILEETGLIIDENSLHFYKLYSDPSRVAEFQDGNILRIITAVYHIHIDSKYDLKCSEESLELKFFTVKELKDLKIAETHKHIIHDYLKE